MTKETQYMYIIPSRASLGIVKQATSKPITNAATVEKKYARP